LETVERPEETFQRTARLHALLLDMQGRMHATRSLAVEEQVSSLALISFLDDAADSLRDVAMAVYALVDSLLEDRFCRNLINSTR
jgi:hypothetical protein